MLRTVGRLSQLQAPGSRNRPIDDGCPVDNYLIENANQSQHQVRVQLHPSVEYTREKFGGPLEMKEMCKDTWAVVKVVNVLVYWYNHDSYRRGTVTTSKKFRVRVL